MPKEQSLLKSSENNTNSKDFVVASPTSYYIRNGLTITSNNNAIIPRDSAGNIIIHENSINNPLLIIEPTNREVDKKSFLETIETRFQYFSFPPLITNTGDTPAPEISLDDILIDPVYARYQPTEPRKILVGPVPSGILMDKLVDGNPTQEINSYFVNKIVKNSGADLRFRIKIEHRFDTPNDEFGTTFFYIAKTNSDSGLNRTYLGPYYNSAFNNEDQQKQFVQNINNFIAATTTYCDLALQISYNSLILFLKRQLPKINEIIITSDIISLTKALVNNYQLNNEIDAINPTIRTDIIKYLNTYESDVNLGLPGQIGQYGVQNLFIDVVIPNSTLEIGDIFSITAYSNVDEEFRYHTINSDTSYWSITNANKLVDDWNQPITGKV